MTLPTLPIDIQNNANWSPRHNKSHNWMISTFSRAPSRPMHLYFWWIFIAVCISHGLQCLCVSGNTSIHFGLLLVQFCPMPGTQQLIHNRASSSQINPNKCDFQKKLYNQLNSVERADAAANELVRVSLEKTPIKEFTVPFLFILLPFYMGGNVKQY